VWRFSRRSRLTYFLPLAVNALARLRSASTLSFISLYRLAGVATSLSPVPCTSGRALLIGPGIRFAGAKVAEFRQAELAP
jgi:hypothetical protein